MLKFHVLLFHHSTDYWPLAPWPLLWAHGGCGLGLWGQTIGCLREESIVDDYTWMLEDRSHQQGPILKIGNYKGWSTVLTQFEVSPLESCSKLLLMSHFIPWGRFGGISFPWEKNCGLIATRTGSLCLLFSAPLCLLGDVFVFKVVVLMFWWQFGVLRDMALHRHHQNFNTPYLWH